MTEDLAGHQGFDLIVGHSLSANVCLEMAARGQYTGRLLLLAPCLAPEDEDRELRQLEVASRIPGLGRLAWAAVHRQMGKVLRDILDQGDGGELSEQRFNSLVEEMKRNPPGLNRRVLLASFAYLRSHGRLVPRLASTKVPVRVVHGERDAVTLREQDRSDLESNDSIGVTTVSDAGHMLMLERPALIAGHIAQFLSE